MKKISILLLTLCLSLLDISSAKAETCDAADIERLQEIANKIQITYEFDENLIDGNGRKYYKDYTVKANGMISWILEDGTVSNDNVNIYNYTLNDTFYYIDDNQKKLEQKMDTLGTTLEFLVYSPVCNKELRTIKVDIPEPNKYYSSDICQNIPGNKVPECDAWNSEKLSDEQVANAVNAYKGTTSKKDNTTNDNSKTNMTFIEFIKAYYIYGLIVIGITAVVIIYETIKRKRSILE